MRLQSRRQAAAPAVNRFLTNLNCDSLPEAAFNGAVKLQVYASTALVGFNESDPRILVVN